MAARHDLAQGQNKRLWEPLLTVGGFVVLLVFSLSIIGSAAVKSTGSKWAPFGAGLNDIFIYAVAPPPAAGGSLLAGTYNHGAFRLVGNRWRTFCGLGDKTVTGFATGSGGTTYAATWGDDVWQCGSTGSRLHTTGLPNPWITAVAVVNGAPYAGVYQAGVYRYQASEWEEFNKGLGDKEVMSLFYDFMHKRLWAGTKTGLYYLNQHAQAWQPVGKSGSSHHEIHAIAMDRRSGRLYAAAAGEGVLVSDKAGTGWHLCKTGLPSGDLGTLYAVAVDDYGFLYAGMRGAGIYRSVDQGWYWSPFNTGLTEKDVLAITTFSSQDGNWEQIVIGTAKGVWHYEEPRAIMKVTLQQKPVTSAGGQKQLEYDITYRNVGDKPASGVVITNAVPAGTQVISGSITGGGNLSQSGDIVSWHLGSVSKRISGTLRYKVNLSKLTYVAVSNNKENAAPLLALSTPSVTPTPPVTSTVAITLQDGLNGYEGTTDSYINRVFPQSDTNYGRDPYIRVKGDDSRGPTEEGLLRFDLYSVLLPGCVIQAAELQL